LHKIYKTMKKIIIFISLILFSFSGFASHYMGGEITWECLPNGNYRFTMKLYRECAGINYSTTESLRSTAPGFAIISMSLLPGANPMDIADGTLDGKTDLSPDCWAHPSPSMHIECSTVGAPNLGALEEWYYTSDVSYPNGVALTGIPPASGWVFYHSSCCRNPSTNILNASSEGWMLRARMFPYTDPVSGVTLNASTCYDNSPVFAEVPSTVICTGYPFTYNHNAFDPELDSLSYEWAQALDQSTTGAVLPLTNYAGGYSYNSPLPGPVHNASNVAAVVDPYTGEISFESYTQGAFVTVTKVTAWRCGQKIAEVFREMQIVLLPCGTNNPPNVQAPFQDPVTLLYTVYRDTVYAGELVTFPISGTDFEFLDPPTNTLPQTLTITASSPMFGTGFTSTTAGCLNPPCATLNPPPPVSAMFGVQSNFSWQTTCDHVATDNGCNTSTNVYNFLIKTSDNYCPAPAIDVGTVTIVVLSKPQIDAPEPRCVSVLPNGDVQLTWIPQTDIDSSFLQYYIYHSNTQVGPYTRIDSINDINIDTYTHTGPNTSGQNNYYYFTTSSGCHGMFESNTSDTLAAILLDVANSGAGSADLTWNHVHNPPLPTTSGVYKIHREYPTGTWALLDSTTNLFYFDTITFCNQFLNYRVELYDSLGCTSVSNVDGDLFQDITPPATPILDSVSVDPSSKTIIGWQANTEPDLTWYIIYQWDGANYIPIDTVDKNTLVYYYGDPTIQSEKYTVAAADSCFNTSPMAAGHNTIFLTTSIDICDDKIYLDWNAYNNMAPTLDGYEIIYNVDGGPWSVLASVGSGSVSYEHVGLTNLSTYCYKVSAYNNTNTTTSISNESCELANQPGQPQFVYLKTATVSDDNHVLLRIYTDTSAYISEYKIMRSIDLAGPFVKIGTLPGGNTNPILTYEDFSVNVKTTSYVYHVIVVDSCDRDALTSNNGKTILCTAEALDDLTNKITWTDYEEWYGAVNYYNLYRSIDDLPDPFPIATVPFGINSYIDDVQNYTMTEGKFAYWIEAIEGLGNMYNFVDTSLSNQSDALQLPRFFVPNAIAPKGYNNRFFPTGVFIDNDDYTFLIFNRWGQVIFETTDPSDAWDGKVNGEWAEEGGYIYYFRFKSTQGKFFEKRGSVTVIY
jgi:gliding motility-associated-like protein